MSAAQTVHFNADSSNNWTSNSGEMFSTGTQKDRITVPAPVSFTYGVASLQLATSGAAALGVGGVVFLHREDGGCLGNRWRSLVEGRGGHQCRGETLTGNIHRLRLLLQSAEGQTRRGTCYCYIHMVYG